MFERNVLVFFLPNIFQYFLIDHHCKTLDRIYWYPRKWQNWLNFLYRVWLAFWITCEASVEGLRLVSFFIHSFKVSLRKIHVFFELNNNWMVMIINFYSISSSTVKGPTELSINFSQATFYYQIIFILYQNNAYCPRQVDRLFLRTVVCRWNPGNMSSHGTISVSLGLSANLMLSHVRLKGRTFQLQDEHHLMDTWQKKRRRNLQQKVTSNENHKNHNVPKETFLINAIKDRDTVLLIHVESSKHYHAAKLWLLAKKPVKFI